MKALFAMTLAIVTAASSMAVMAAEGPVRHGWRCDAYGVGGPRGNTWQTVTGGIEGTEERARQNAETYCSQDRHLNACRTSGCWPE